MFKAFLRAPILFVKAFLKAILSIRAFLIYVNLVSMVLVIFKRPFCRDSYPFLRDPILFKAFFKGSLSLFKGSLSFFEAFFRGSLSFFKAFLRDSHPFLKAFLGVPILF